MSKFNWSNPPYKIKKDGTQSKLHDRSVFRTPGNEVELAYGTFTVLKAEKVNKIWYVTLKDVNETFKIKQQQMGNKKLPKTRVIINDMQPVIAGLLPAPKELIDQLVEQVERLVNQYNQQLLSNPANYTTRGKLKSNIRRKLVQLENDAVTIVDKVIYISNILNTGIYAYKYITITQAKEIHKKLQQRYHPDRNNGATTELFQEIQDIFDWL